MFSPALDAPARLESALVARCGESVGRRAGTGRRGAAARALAIREHSRTARKREHRTLQVREEAVKEYLTNTESTVRIIADRHGVSGPFVPLARLPGLSVQWPSLLSVLSNF